MKHLAKRTSMIIGGFCWLGFAITFALFLVASLLQENELSFVGLALPSESTLIGLAHLSGLVAASLVSFIIGVGLCAHGIVPRPEDQNQKPRQSKQFLAPVADATSVPSHRKADWRCTRCYVDLRGPVHICAECGWTQPYETH